MRFTHSTHPRGFTLIEIIIAIGILAMMMFSISQITTGITTARDKAQARNEEKHTVILALTKMSDDLRAAFLTDKKFWGKDSFYKTGLVGDVTSINFSSLSNVHRVQDNRDTDQVDVGYSLERNDDGSYRLLRRSTDYLVDKLDEGGQSFVLLNAIKDIKFEYYNSNQKEWQATWDTESIETMGRLPQQVRVTLSLIGKSLDEDEEESQMHTFELVIPIEMYDKKITF